MSKPLAFSRWRIDSHESDSSTLKVWFQNRRAKWRKQSAINETSNSSGSIQQTELLKNCRRSSLTFNLGMYQRDLMTTDCLLPDIYVDKHVKRFLSVLSENGSDDIIVKAGMSSLTAKDVLLSSWLGPRCST